MILKEKLRNILNDFITRKLHKTVAFSVLLFLLPLWSIQLHAQGRLGNFKTSTGRGTASSSQPIKRDTVVSVIPDSLVSAENDLETTVEYSAEDSTIMDVDGKTVYLYGNAQVDYGDISLTADYIQLSWGNSEVFAHGLPDTTIQVGEQVSGKPIFKQGADSYNTDTIRYNFRSRKAIIKHIVTQEGDGIIQGDKVKKDSIDNLYLVDAKYTTCDLKEPHFHIASRKIKLVNKKSVISGPFNFVLAGVPLPVGLPFGFFPVPKKKEIGTSGFIMGTYGEEPGNRGFYFRDFGYYHAFNEYIGAKVLAQIYSKGSWGLGVQSQYTKRYKYTGNLNLQFNYNKPVDEFSLNGISRDFNISWSHSPQNKRPDRSFSANVNLVSNSFNQNNVRLDAVNQYTNNTFGSGVQYSRNFGSILRTSTALNINQNVSTEVLNGGLTYSIGLNQFNPFVKEKNKTGRWFESFRVGLDVRGGYSFTNVLSTQSTTYFDYNIAGYDNDPLTVEEENRILELQNLLSSLLISDEERASYQAELKQLTNPTATGLGNILGNGEFTNSYSVPIALPNIKLFKHINITPSVSYRGDFFSRELNYTFANPESSQKYTLESGKVVTVSVDNSLDGIEYNYNDNGDLSVTLNENSGGVVLIDTLNRPAFGQRYSFGTSMNTRVYGTYRFKSGRRVSAIRHTIAPSISLSYTPDLDGQYAQNTVVRQSADGTTTSRYLPRFINGSTTNQSAAGNIGFSLTNNLEAKVRSKSDTSETEYEKISLLDNFGISTSYNMLADKNLGEFGLAPLSFNANTNIFKDLIRVNAGGTLDPYAYELDDQITSNKAGVKTTDFKWTKDGYSGDYLSQFRLALSTRLSPKSFQKEEPKKESDDPARDAMEAFVRANPMAYVDFSIPWSINLSYSLNYSKQGFADARVTQAIQMTGDLSITPKWKVTYSTGWDFVTKAVTLTNIGMMRELHCWDMSFNWTPIAGNTSRASNYSFDLRVRSSLLSDLKISRRRIYYDRGGF
ncbi:putative LPS assembly protein LptD [Jiulongibacter sp. NS-SX5]|uniref:putative LPS assembly protein LptD n=1 Tax=Jiulongibacter sp. NS-SX5 TaxID=3463854 RepID=UPI00405815D1